MKTISTLRLAVASVLALGVVNAYAAWPNSADMNVQAIIADSCVISVADMDFGNYDPVDANKANDSLATAVITTACTLGSAPHVKLLGATDNTDRVLTSGANTLSYGLYDTFGRTVGWDVATGESITATGVDVTTTIFGKIPQNQNKPLGTYTQVVTVQVGF